MKKSLDISNALSHKKIFIDSDKGFALISYFKDPLSCLRFDFNILRDKNPVVKEFRSLPTEYWGELLHEELKEKFCHHIMEDVLGKMGGSFEPFEASVAVATFELHFKKKKRSFDIKDLLFPQLPTVTVTVEDVIKEIIDTGELFFRVTEDDLRSAVDSIKKNLV